MTQCRGTDSMMRKSNRNQKTADKLMSCDFPLVAPGACRKCDNNKAGLWDYSLKVSKVRGFGGEWAGIKTLQEITDGEQKRFYNLWQNSSCRHHQTSLIKTVTHALFRLAV